MKIEPGKTGKAKGISTYNKLDIIDLLNRLDVECEKAFDKVKLKNPIMKTKRLYFAGPWFSQKSKAFYEAAMYIAELVYNYSEYCIYFPMCQVNETPYDAYKNNVTNIVQCDTLVAFVDEKDTGTAWEIGMASALNKDIILIGLDETTFLSHTNVMLAFSGTCITLSEFAKFLSGLNYNTIKIKNQWEGIE